MAFDMTETHITLTPKARRTRDALLNAGRNAIGVHGVSNANVMEICATAKVGRTSFYTYFDDLDQLVTEIAEAATQDLKAQFDDVHQNLPRGLQRLEACLGMILEVAIEQPETALLITSLADTSSEIKRTIETEIDAELQAAGQNASKRHILTSYLFTSTTAIARALASGTIDAKLAPDMVKALMRACV